MTFTAMVAEVMGRLNLTSTDAQTRVGQRINDRYRRVTSSIGLHTSRRTTVDVVADASEPGNTLPELLVPGLEKVTRVSYTTGTNVGVRTLKEQTYDDLTAANVRDAQPRSWAVVRMDAGEVTIVIDGFPSSEPTPLTLNCEGYDITDVLAGSQEPVLPTDFHDILVEGAMSDELRKMEKADLAQIAETKYEQRLSDLRMFIAKSAYLDIIQGKNRPNRLWTNLWRDRFLAWD